MAANTSHPRDCFNNQARFYVFTLFTVVTLLLLSLSLYILYLGFSQWKQRHSASHLDHFTFHMAAMELIPVCGCVMFIIGAFYDDDVLIERSFPFLSPNWSTKIHFNTLTCVERYLAVVHPITYLGLKKRGGVLIRNVSIGFLWLLCLGWFAFDLISNDKNSVTFVVYGTLCLMSFSLGFITTSFCNVSVLCVLVRPSPAKGGGKKVKVDQAKNRVLHTVAAIFGVLLFGTCGILVSETLALTQIINECVFFNACVWFPFPSSLVLPLLFLHRSGKFSC